MPNIRVKSMHPLLHPRVQSLLDDENLVFTFRARYESNDHIKDRDTRVTGKFECPNKRCRNKWSSVCIAIWIRLYHGNEYTVVVYHQRCLKCNALAKPTLDDTYEERVARCLKIWSNIKIPREHHEHKRTAPHESSRCEGCKAGHCQDY
ncbi:zinc finger protein [Cordyceps militaris]|uniref:Zinc finger protein n=1 Tax=Cordyceps militaris TaxID=73501 RepID=A0A2H4SJ26_CORMI|nr:zinc finger protein [Cordyceps militaris]